MITVKEEKRGAFEVILEAEPMRDSAITERPPMESPAFIRRRADDMDDRRSSIRRNINHD